MTAGSRPRVGISRCLIGDDVRYDGGHKRDGALLDAVSHLVEWVPVCPEVEVGMGVPREPIHLVQESTRIRLVGVTSAADWTDRMEGWARQRIAELDQLNLSGFVLKARSPSCGVRDVPIHSAEQAEVTGRGVFARILSDLHPDLPMEDEERLHDAQVRGDFIDRVTRYRRHTR